MSLNKKMAKLIKNRPQYKVDGAYAANEAIARNAAYGRSTSAINAESSMAESAAAATDQVNRTVGSAAQAAASAAQIQADRNKSSRELADTESNVRLAGTQALMHAQTASAEERDKEWNHNVNEPYQNQVQALRDRKKARQELAMKGIDTAAAIATSFIPGGKSA